MSEQSRAFVPGSASRSGNDIVSLESTDGDEFDVLDIQSRQETFKFLPNLQEPCLAPVHQVHFVDRDDQMRNPKQRSYEGMPAALFADPMRASTRMMERLAVEAPVTMLRVY